VSDLMTHGRRSKYFWPASAITPADMALVYAVRESSQPRVPISELIARAIRQQYGQVSVLNLPAVPITHQDMKEAA
jgi:hypothetical protein